MGCSKHVPVNIRPEINARSDMGEFARRSRIEEGGMRSRTSVRTTAAAGSISVPLVCTNNHFTLPHPASANPAPPDHRARVGFCQWFLAKCFVSTQIIVDSEGFWRWCITHRITGFFWTFPSSGILETRKHDVSDTICFRPQVKGGE
jgi:hypothetical protein